MKASEDCFEIIKHYEDLKLVAYICPAGKLTIGYGHLMQQHEDFTEITEEQAADILKRDVAWAEQSVNDLVLKPLEQHQYDALVSFVFNIGRGAFKSSTLLKFLNMNYFKLAAGQFDLWNKASGRVLNGLIARRLTERDLFNGFGVNFYEVEG